MEGILAITDGDIALSMGQCGCGRLSKFFSKNEDKCIVSGLMDKNSQHGLGDRPCIADWHSDDLQFSCFDVVDIALQSDAALIRSMSSEPRMR